MVVNSLMATKLVGMTILGSVSIVCGMIPILISKKLGWTRSSGSGADSLSPFARSLLSGILCFGGGILMGTGFLHMLPEVYEGWQTYAQTNHIDVNLALGIVVICAGFFLVYFVEEVVHLIVDRYAHNRADASLHRAVSIRGCPVGFEPAAGASTGAESSVDGETCQSNSICKQSNCETEKEFCRDAEASGERKCCTSVDHSSNNAIIPTISVTNLPSMTDRYGTFGRSISEEPIIEEKNINLRVNKHHHKSSDSKGHSHHHGHHHHGLDGSLKLHGLFIVIALSLHEILEGMAIGLQNDTTGVIQLCTAVAAHKFVISFCVGLELSTNGVKLLVHTIYIFTFSLVTPIGAGIGIAMTSHLNDGDPDHSLGSLIMQGLACGTILYVAFFEILERERAKEMVGLIQWTLLVLGFLAILGLQTQAREPSDIPAEPLINASSVISALDNNNLLNITSSV